MNCSLSTLTAFNVADQLGHWGKLRDLLIDLPSLRCRYLSVDASEGLHEPELWAPVEALARVDPLHGSLEIRSSLDKASAKRIAMLSAPSGDLDELRLHRLYRTRPAWSPALQAKAPAVRRGRSRLFRCSSLVGFDVLTHAGERGRVSDLYFDDKDLSLSAFSLELDWDQGPLHWQFWEGRPCKLFPDGHGIYLDLT